MGKVKSVGEHSTARKARPPAVLAPPPDETPAADVYPGEPLNFRVQKDFKRLFKSTAAPHGLRMNELVVEAFYLWVREKGLEGRAS